MKKIGILLIALLWFVPAEAVVVTCVSEGGNVVRIDYSAGDEPILPVAFALDLTVDGGATITSVYDYKVGDSTATSPGFGIFPSSMKIDEKGTVSDWGRPEMSSSEFSGVLPGLGTAGVTIGMASRYSGTANAPGVRGTLCRIRVDPRGAPGVNVKVAQNTSAGGVVLEDATPAKFSGVGCTLGVAQPPLPPQAPASITYPSTSRTGQYTVSWTSAMGATSYQLECSANNGATWTQIYSGTALSYAESVGNGTYRYRVQAANATGVSTWTVGTNSCVVNISSPGKRPKQPDSITYPASSDTGTYTVQWAASADAASYRLERSRNGDDWSQVYAGPGASYEEDVDNGRYRYRVRAENAAGASSWRTGSRDCVVSLVTPPPAGTATVGNVTVFPAASAVRTRRAAPYRMPSVGRLQSISLYHQGGSGQVLLAVYADKSGRPGERLAVTEATTVTSTAGWQTVALQRAVSVSAGQKIWLAWVFQNNVAVRATSGTPGRAESRATWSGGMPSTFGGSTVANYIYSIYATYSPEEGPQGEERRQDREDDEDDDDEDDDDDREDD